MKNLSILPFLAFALLLCSSCSIIDRTISEIIFEDVNYIGNMPLIDIPGTKIQVDKNSLKDKSEILYGKKNGSRLSDIKKSAIDCYKKTIQIKEVWISETALPYWESVTQSPKTPTKDEMKMIEFVCRS